MAGGGNRAGPKWDPFAAWKRGKVDTNRANDKTSLDAGSSSPTEQRQGQEKRRDGEGDGAPVREDDAGERGDDGATFTDHGLPDAEPSGESESEKKARVNNTIVRSLLPSPPRRG